MKLAPTRFFLQSYSHIVRKSGVGLIYFIDWFRKTSIRNKLSMGSRYPYFS
jgi:hypothetical protein